MTATYKVNNRPNVGFNEERLSRDTQVKPLAKEQAGTRICIRCGALGMHKHWFVDKKMTEKVAADPLVRYVVCPGCRRTEDQVYEGQVLLDSPLILQNKEMVFGTIYHTAAKAYQENPLSRVAHIQESGNKIYMLTTTKTLAVRLGKAIHRALKGHLEIKPSPGEQYVIVNWLRP
jgi:hypothetical protein